MYLFYYNIIYKKSALTEQFFYFKKSAQTEQLFHFKNSARTEQFLYLKKSARIEQFFNYIKIYLFYYDIIYKKSYYL